MIRFNDNVDTEAFNSMARWATDIRCLRMKRVKAIHLKDHQEQEGRQARSLYFADWMEMSAKNAQQLK